MVDEGLGHHEVGDYDGDNHGVIFVYGLIPLKSLSAKVIGERLHGDGVST